MGELRLMVSWLQYQHGVAIPRLFCMRAWWDKQDPSCFRKLYSRSTYIYIYLVMLWALLHPSWWKPTRSRNVTCISSKSSPYPNIFWFGATSCQLCGTVIPRSRGWLQGCAPFRFPSPCFSWFCMNLDTRIAIRQTYLTSLWYVLHISMPCCLVLSSLLLSRLLSDDLRLCNYDYWGQQGDRRVGCLDRLMRCKTAWWSLMFDVLNKHVRGQLVCLHYAWIRLLRKCSVFNMKRCNSEWERRDMKRYWQVCKLTSKHCLTLCSQHFGASLGNVCLASNGGINEFLTARRNC